VLSFTVEPDGRLPNGQPLHEALAETEAETGGGAVFCRVNCARPVHLARELSGTMRARIGGIRAHASRLSYAGMDESTTLGDGDPVGFRPFCATFARYLPNLRLAAGCCGSDHRHVGKPCRHLHAHAEGQPVHMHQATCRRLRTTSGAKACF
jgi:homocysteine S-methyltransferase